MYFAIAIVNLCLNTSLMYVLVDYFDVWYMFSQVLIGGMVAIGPVLGGWLATDFTWRLAFNVNAPFGILILIGLKILLEHLGVF